MAHVDKVSLRQEFVTLKSQFKRLNDTGKLNDESRLLIQAMVTLFEVLIAVFMEKRTVKNTRNSSLPSSQTGKDESASKPGSKGKQVMRTPRYSTPFSPKKLCAPSASQSSLPAGSALWRGGCISA